MKKFWAVPTLIFLVLVLVYPIIVLLTRGVQFSVIANSFILERLMVTFGQALLSGGLVLLLALVFGSLFARYDFWGKHWLEAWLGVPFVVPIIVAGLGFLALFGSRGWIGHLEGTLWLVILANLFYNLGMATRLVMTSLAVQSLDLEAVAKLEGANSWQVWRFVTVPAALPSALSGAGFTFLYTFASFGVPLLLGGSAFATLEVEMYRSVERLELETAAALGIMQLLVTSSAAWFVTSLERQLSTAQENNPSRPRATGWTRGLLGLAVLIVLALTTMPLLAVAFKSFINGLGFTLEHYAALFTASNSIFSSNLSMAVWNNLRFAGLALLIAIPLGISFAIAIWQQRSAFLDAISLLPMMISAVLLGVALIITYPTLTASLPLLIAMYTLTAYPFITRATLIGLRQIEPSILEAAALDGANFPQQSYYMVLPLLEPQLRNGIGLAFAVIVGEFAATLTLSRPEWATLSTLIYQHLARPNRIGEASALAVLLLLFTMSGYAVINWRKKS